MGFCGFGPARKKDVIEQEARRRLRPLLGDEGAQRGVSATDQSRRAILHHRHQFRRSLARVQRDDNQAFRHDGQVHRHPANAIRRQQHAAVAFFESSAGQEGARPPDQAQQLGTRHLRGPVLSPPLQHRNLGRFFGLRENLFQKVHCAVATGL